MTANEAAIRKAYQVAENKDITGWVNCFTEDGTFTDESIGVTYRGLKELGRKVEVYAARFPICIGSCTHSTSLVTPSSSNSRCRTRTRGRWNCPSASFRRRKKDERSMLRRVSADKRQD